MDSLPLKSLRNNNTETSQFCKVLKYFLMHIRVDCGFLEKKNQKWSKREASRTLQVLRESKDFEILWFRVITCYSTE